MGASFLVLWARQNGSATEARGTRVAFDGSILDVPSFVYGPRLASAVTGGPSHQALTLAPFTTQLGASQFAIVPITHGAPLGNACTSPASCGSGFCVDGVCCESACGGDGTADCGVCSTAFGSSANGQCELISACSKPPGAVQLLAPSGTIVEKIGRAHV